jgi:hypothetical protein
VVENTIAAAIAPTATRDVEMRTLITPRLNV